MKGGIALYSRGAMGRVGTQEQTHSDRGWLNVGVRDTIQGSENQSLAVTLQSVCEEGIRQHHLRHKGTWGQGYIVRWYQAVLSLLMLIEGLMLACAHLDGSLIAHIPPRLASNSDIL